MRALPASAFLLLMSCAAACSSKDLTPSANGALAGGGTSGSPGVATMASGSRLRVKSVIAADAHQAIGFFDTARNEDCSFQPAEPGHTRCLPPLSTRGFSESSGQTFADAQCQTPIATSSGIAACDGGTYVVAYDSSSCARTAGQIRKILDASVPVYVSKSNTCILQASTTAAPSSYIAVSEPVPWTDFVEGTETVLPGAVVSERVVKSVDGAMQHIGYRIDALAADCDFRVLTSGETRCVPNAQLGQVSYSDASCTQPAFVTDYNSGGCTDATVATNVWLEQDGAAAACNAVRAAYTVSGTFQGSTDAWVKASSSGPGALGTAPGCTANYQGSYGTKLAIQKDITATLPNVDRIATGTARLVPALVEQMDLPTLGAGFHDTAHDVDCVFTTASDGKLRCLPNVTEAQLLFTDAACQSTSQVALFKGPRCLGFTAYAKVTSATCPSTTTIYALIATPRDLTVASTMTNGKCAMLSGATNAYEASVVDPSQFVEGTLATE